MGKAPSVWSDCLQIGRVICYDAFPGTRNTRQLSPVDPLESLVDRMLSPPHLNKLWLGLASPFYTILYYIILYDTILYYIILYYIILYYIIL